jgi:hypothetical protein
MIIIGRFPVITEDAWVVGNRSNTVWVISPRGKLLQTLHSTYKGKTVLTHPIGNAADSYGNIWVANSDWLDAPCATRTMLGPAQNPSITMFQMNRGNPIRDRHLRAAESHFRGGLR